MKNDLLVNRHIGISEKDEAQMLHKIGVFQWGKTGIRVTAEINNIFNQQYEVVQCYPMPGTSFKIKLNVMLWEYLFLSLIHI